MNRSKKKNFVIYSSDELLSQRLEQFKTENQKLYQKIIEALQILGDFPIKIEVGLYESKDTEEEKYSKLWCSDLNGNIFIFYLESILKKDKTILEKMTNNTNQTYDLSLAKKFNLTSDNIDLTQTSKIFGFKFGRLITDENSFYNLFLGENVCYQIQIEGNETNVPANELLSALNKLENIPTFKHYTDIFAQIVNDKQITYDSVLLGAYKNFESIGTLVINNDQKAKILTK